MADKNATDAKNSRREKLKSKLNPAAKSERVKVEETDDEQGMSEKVAPLQKQMIYQWQAPIRPYKRLDKDVFSTILAGAFLLGIILYFIDGPMPVLALISLLFLLYVMGTVPPGKITHTITSWGVETDNKLYVWELMTNFWVEGEKAHRMLVINLNLNWPRTIRLMIGDGNEEELLEIFREFVIEEKPRPNWLDKSSGWIQSKIRLTPEN